jgi:hypothetical protein
LFIKLDILKAFDMVNWLYLLDIMTFLGFGQKWRNWMSSLWCTTSSSVLLNGEPGARVLHCRGVRQGDPLPPMLFLLAMKPLQLLFKKAMQAQLISKLTPNCDFFWVSLYADDVALFLKPRKEDLDIMNCILDLFADASGLITNLSKTQAHPIRCDHVDMSFLNDVNIPIANVPYSYLGLPLHFRRPFKSSFYPLVQKIGGRLP